MSSQAGQVRTVRNRQYYEDPNGTTWTRRMKRDGSWTEWEIHETEPEPEPQVAASPVYLSVVQKSQAEGEPLHWLLFIASEGSPGTVYQATGDATFMHYNHASNIDIVHSESFYNIYHLCEIDEAGVAWVNYYAYTVPPPQAPNRAAVTQNCQHWVIEVLRALQSVGVVSQEKVDQMESMVQPIV